MKTLKSKITVKGTIATSISVLVGTLFVWWGMHFPGLMPTSADADTFPIVCSGELHFSDAYSDPGQHRIAVADLFAGSDRISDTAAA